MRSLPETLVRVADALRASPSRVLASVAVLASAPAFAQDGAADRAEMDLAAGRVLFQNSPLSDRIVEVRLPPPPAPTTDASPPRRAVRVVLPSPYPAR